eukprot:jgi/Antlo1/163/771
MMRRRDQSLQSILKIQSLCARYPDLALSLPQIVVVGPQSSGKSSVLEQIIQRDILPRGHDLVTRCPVVINMRPANGEEFVEFGDGCRIYKLECVRDEIERRMNSVCGTNRGISAEAITMFVHLKNALQLTLVDLPGLTKIPKGDQPLDIETRVASLIVEYAREKNTFILAIVSANVDIANSEALKIASQVDSEGMRTLGVVTKIDLMDDGTNCLDILKNIAHPLKHGYVGVINRTQAQINMQTSLADAQKQEERFFARSAVYRCVSERCGSRYLTSKLFEIFSSMVTAEMPRIENRLHGRLAALRSELGRTKEPRDLTDTDRHEISLSYHRTICELIDGCPSKNPCFTLRNKVNLVCELKKEFKCDFGDLNVNNFIKEELTYSSSLFMSDRILHMAFIRKAAYLRECVNAAIDRFHARVVDSILNVASAQYPLLVDRLNESTRDAICMQCTRLGSAIGEHFEIQTSFLNFDHPDFSTSRIIANVLESSAKSKKPRKNEIWGFLSRDTENERPVLDSMFELKVVLGLVDEYYKMFNKSFVDFAIKSCYYFYLSYMKESLPTSISAELANMSMGNLEDPHVKERRSMLKEEVAMVEETIRNIKQV